MENTFVALQLHTVRDIAASDPAVAFRAVKEMGYDFVELAGTYGLEFAALRERLDEFGLHAISAHVPAEALRDDLTGQVSAYKRLGCKYIAIPMLNAECLPGGEKYDETRDFLRQFCVACNMEGLIPAYHNHAHEFVRLHSGEFKLDALLGDVPELFVQFDTGWVKSAGQNPVAYIEKYAGRCPVIHLKDTAVNSYYGYEDRPVGKGLLDVPAIISAAQKSGTEGLIVEVGKPGDLTSLEVASESRRYLKSLGH